MAREKRVLVIDDQPRVLEVLRELLASFQHGYKYEISTAQSVDGALGILEREHFDLILLDMVLPGIGDPLLRRQGIDLLKRIRRLGINAPTEIPVHRQEVYEAIKRENLRSARMDPKEAQAIGRGAGQDIAPKSNTGPRG